MDLTPYPIIQVEGEWLVIKIPVQRFIGQINPNIIQQIIGGNLISAPASTSLGVLNASPGITEPGKPPSGITEPGNPSAAVTEPGNPSAAVTEPVGHVDSAEATTGDEGVNELITTEVPVKGNLDFSGRKETRNKKGKPQINMKPAKRMVNIAETAKSSNADEGDDIGSIAGRRVMAKFGSKACTEVRSKEEELKEKVSTVTETKRTVKGVAATNADGRVKNVTSLKEPEPGNLVSKNNDDETMEEELLSKENVGSSNTDKAASPEITPVDLVKRKLAFLERKNVGGSNEKLQLKVKPIVQIKLEDWENARRAREKGLVSSQDVNEGTKKRKSQQISSENESDKESNVSQPKLKKKLSKEDIEQSESLNVRKRKTSVSRRKGDNETSKNEINSNKDAKNKSKLNKTGNVADFDKSVNDKEIKKRNKRVLHMQNDVNIVGIKMASESLVCTNIKDIIPEIPDGPEKSTTGKLPLDSHESNSVLNNSADAANTSLEENVTPAEKVKVVKRGRLSSTTKMKLKKMDSESIKPVSAETGLLDGVDETVKTKRKSEPASGKTKNIHSDGDKNIHSDSDVSSVQVKRKSDFKKRLLILSSDSEVDVADTDTKKNRRVRFSQKKQLGDNSEQDLDSEVGLDVADTDTKKNQRVQLSQKKQLGDNSEQDLEESNKIKPKRGRRPNRIGSTSHQEDKPLESNKGLNSRQNLTESDVQQGGVDESKTLKQKLLSSDSELDALDEKVRKQKPKQRKIKKLTSDSEQDVTDSDNIKQVSLPGAKIKQKVVESEPEHNQDGIKRPRRNRNKSTENQVQDDSEKQESANKAKETGLQNIDKLTEHETKETRKPNEKTEPQKSPLSQLENEEQKKLKRKPRSKSVDTSIKTDSERETSEKKKKRGRPTKSVVKNSDGDENMLSTVPLNTSEGDVLHSASNIESETETVVDKEMEKEMHENIPTAENVNRKVKKTANPASSDVDDEQVVIKPKKKRNENKRDGSTESENQDNKEKSDSPTISYQAFLESLEKKKVEKELLSLIDESHRSAVVKVVDIFSDKAAQSIPEEDRDTMRNFLRSCYDVWLAQS